MSEPRAEISPWAEHLAELLAEARLRAVSTAALEYAATGDVQIAYEVLITLSRSVALVLRPDGHPGGPIGNPAGASLQCRMRAAQLVGFAAQGDADMVDALARAALAAPDPLEEARHTIWSTLEVLASEHVIHPDPQEGLHS